MFIPAGALVFVIVLLACLVWRKCERAHGLPPGTPAFNLGDGKAIPFAPGVDTKEFARLFANTLLDERGRRIFPEILKAGTGWITWREIMLMRLLLGEMDPYRVNDEIWSHASWRDAGAIARQLKVLTSAVKAAPIA